MVDELGKGGALVQSLIDRLFEFAQERGDALRRPPWHIEGPPLTRVGSGLQTHLFLGTERQLSDRHGWLAQRIVEDCFRVRDAIFAARAKAWLALLIGQIFRNHAPQRPGMIWVAPAWLRTSNLYRQNIRRRDTTLPLDRHQLGDLVPQVAQIPFPSGGLIRFDLKLLPIWYPHKAVQQLLIVPRVRELVDDRDRVAWTAIEYGMGLGDEEEARGLLRDGSYTPNDHFAAQAGELSFLDVWTVSMARFALPAGPAPRFELSPLTRRLAGRNARIEEESLLDEVHELDDPTVAFVRVTLRPEDLRPIVPLVTEREFSRFCYEHHNLWELLHRALDFPGIVDA